MPTIHSENWDSSSTGTFLPAGWIQSPNMTIESASSFSASNAIWYPTNITPGTAVYTAVNDGNGGYAVASHVTWATAKNISLLTYVLCRVTTASTTLTGNVCYYAAMDFVANGIDLGYFGSGAKHSLVSRTGPTLGTTDKYRVFLECIGTAITLRVQRTSDSKWLDSSNVWQVAQQDYLTTTDSNVAAAPGNAGIALSRFNGSDVAYSDDFLWETAGSPVVRRMNQVISF